MKKLAAIAILAALSSGCVILESSISHPYIGKLGFKIDLEARGITKVIMCPLDKFLLHKKKSVEPLCKCSK